MSKTEKEVKVVFSRNLKRLASKKSVLQKDVAERMGLPETTVSSWFRGKHLPDVPKGLELAEYLEVTLDDLFSCVNRDQKINKLEKEISLLEEQAKEPENSKSINLFEAISEVKKKGGMVIF